MNSTAAQIPIQSAPPSVPKDNVLPFAHRKVTRTVAIPRGLATPSEVGTIVNSGRTLERSGALDDDVLIFRMNFTSDQLADDSICVFRDDEGSFTIRRYADENREPFGLVFAVQRPIGGLTKKAKGRARA